jgi:uncharacterized protein (TIGR02266 family)
MPAVLRVDYPNLSRFMADYSENISKNGLFIATDQAYEMGEMVEFDLSFPGLLEPTRLRGRVRWIRSDGTKGVGLELLFDDDQARGQVERITEARPRSDQRKFSILLADDNPHVREMFRYSVEKLSQDGLDVFFEMSECADGAEAWDRLGKDHFDMLLLDIYMPVLDGYELMRRVRSSPKLRWLPIVAVSGSADSRGEALANGADIFLAKPVKLADIVLTVKTLLRLDR